MVAVQSTTSPFDGMLVIVLVVLIAAAWVLLAASRFIQGGTVERPNRVPQLYGYGICFVAVITLLVSLGSIVGDVFTLAEPASALTTSRDVFFDASLASFESYRATRATRQNLTARPGATPPSEPTDSALRAEYTALRADRIATAHVNAVQSLLKSLVLIAVALVLFIVHWRWVRTLRDTLPGEPRATGPAVVT